MTADISLYVYSYYLHHCEFCNWHCIHGYIRMQTLYYNNIYHLHMQYSAELVKLLPSKGDYWELLGYQFKVGTKLGEGNYGVVYKGALSMDTSTPPVQRHIDTVTQDGKCPYTVAIKLLKGEPT